MPDDLAENLAEVYLRSATSGEEQAEDLLNDYVPEEAGGPFLEVDAVGDALDLDLPAAPGAPWDRRAEHSRPGSPRSR